MAWRKDKHMGLKQMLRIIFTADPVGASLNFLLTSSVVEHLHLPPSPLPQS